MSQKLKLTRLIVPLLVCLGLAPIAQAVNPPPDGGYPGFNTAEGDYSLFNLTTGQFNTAIGFNALRSNTTGNHNVAFGLNTLLFNTTGTGNMGVGGGCLRSNLTGNNNTAVGYQAMSANTVSDNSAIGYQALFHNMTGTGNVANGFQAAFANAGGSYNTANGWLALPGNTSGIWNVADGAFALGNNDTGSYNVAVGVQAGLGITSGDRNTCLGTTTCGGTTTADNVVCVGWGAAGENISDRAYIPNIGQFAQASGGGVEFVTVRLTDGKLGHSLSSRRYKEDIKSMGDASELIYKLKPVSFRYKKTPEQQSDNLDYGLIAEDVAEIDPQLAIRNGKGQIESLRYLAVYNMMLNEFLKEHRKVEAQQATIAELKSTMDVLTAQLKEQAAQIQKVSAQLETSKPAPHVVVNTP